MAADGASSNGGGAGSNGGNGGNGNGGGAGGGEGASLSPEQLLDLFLTLFGQQPPPALPAPAPASTSASATVTGTSATSAVGGSGTAAAVAGQPVVHADSDPLSLDTETSIEPFPGATSDRVQDVGSQGPTPQVGPYLAPI
jgi:hypothetical protein